jgi:hypothetical protein
MMPLASGGEDMVEISDRAMRLHRHDRVVALERARVEKTARELMPEILGALDAGKAVVVHSPVDGQAAVTDAVISETADILLGLLAG